MSDLIHGGLITVRERVDNMYRHLPVESRRKREAALVDRARREYPWAPKNLTVSYGQSHDYHYYLTITLAVPDCVRQAAVEERLSAARHTRCACGSYGSWDNSVSGTSEDVPCVWAGCPTCSGTAVGRPILRADLEWYERHTGQTVA